MAESAQRGARLAVHRFHHSGSAPLRALLIGDARQVLADAGGSSLAERTADRVWLSTRRGVDLDVLTDLAPVLRAVQGVFRTWRLWRYDVVVVVVGDGLDALLRPRTHARVRELLREVLGDAASATDVVVVGPQHSVRHAAASDERLRELVEPFRSEHVRACSVPVAADAVVRGRAWSTAVAGAITASLDRQRTAPGTATAAARRDEPEDEGRRQEALDGLHVVGSPRDPRLDDLVELARTAFGTESAEINFIDHDRQWKMAAAGAARDEEPRADSFCNLTVQRSTPTVVGDTRLHPLLATNPAVLGPRPVRFYAAHPIESADGYRIGSFCIYDPEPRDVRDLDLSVLRDLALLAQAEIIAADSPPAGIAPLLTP